MIDAVLAKIFGTQNERDIKAIRPKIAAINALEPALQQLSDIDLAAHEPEFSDFRWVSLDELPDLIVPFKRETYKAVIAAFKNLA